MIDFGELISTKQLLWPKNIQLFLLLSVTTTIHPDKTAPIYTAGKYNYILIVLRHQHGKLFTQYVMLPVVIDPGFWLLDSGCC